ncbi:MAG: PKD domain-containing protein, partial [Bacteroidetes bacterium]|nr:PKD domain-containing protein [Bacteroidota bacterium]
TNKFYSSNIATPTLAADKYQCSNFNGNFTVIGYFYNSYGADSYYVNSCDNISVSQNYYLSIGPGDNNYAGGNLFPYEYRNWAHISTLTAIVPPGYTYISARFNQLRTAGTLASNTSPWETIVPVNPNADTLVFNAEPFFQGFGGTIPLSDDGFHGKLEVIIQPSCEVTPTISQGIQYDWNFGPTAYLTGPGSDTVFETDSDQIIYDPPVLFLQSVLPSIFALDSTTSWDISISNTSNVSDALNTWISGPTISGVAITKVVDLDSNIVIPLTDSIYKVGTVNAADVRHFRITASFISCGPDSVIVHSGWNCNAGYPTGLGTYPCVSKKITLTLTPLTPAFLINSEGPSTSIQLCDTAEFSAECVNVQLGTAYNVILKATLPTGATLIPGSSLFSYPLSDPAITISDPTLISGNEWKWDITAIDSVIGANGLKGILDTILNSFRVRFKFITDCSYTSGSSVAFVAIGNAACGSATEPDISLSPSLDIIGAIEPYSTSVILSTTYVSPCAGNSNIRVVIHNQGPTAFGVTDSIVVQLPIGVPFIAGSFNGIYNAPLNGIPLQYSLSGITYLVWKLPIGTVAGDSCIFSFEYIGDPPALACGIILFEAKTYSISTITCVATGNNCVTQIITGDTTLPVFTYKAYLSLSNGFATAIPNPPGGETVTISYDITNTGQAILTDADSIVQFYFDANGDGIYSTGDVFIAEDTLLIPKDSTMRFTSIFNAPAGQACSIIALIDPAVNSCVCDFSQLLITSLLRSLGNDSTLCSGETITLSSAPVTGYTYSWTPITGLNDPTIANTVLTTSNLTSAPIPTSYILSTNRIGCTSADTLVITVNPLPTGTVTGTIDVCENSGAPSVIFVGSGSTGPYTFTYNINGGSNQTLTSTNGDSAIVLAPTNVPGTFIYNLISVQDSSSTACAQPQSSSATITVNPLPLASALIGGTTEVCKGGTSPNITFTGSVGTPPFTFTYTINNGSLLTATTISGNSIIVSAPTSTAGIFVYNLLSVQDASSTTCSQPQSGSATITINPLPTATIGGSVAVCREATAPDITFVGSNGTAPYTFTYTINGGSNQTVISTNGDTAIVPASTVADGTFVYTLVSVIDASITTCSQSQSGTATVIVDPLPTATISGTTSLCQGFPAPNITFVGYGGVRPYIFTFTINGVVQPTVTATGVDSVTLPAPTTIAGIFTYSLVSVQDANLAACTHPQTGNAIITVHPKPIAAFASTKVCNGNATQFNDSSTTLSGTIISWVWDMGDGSPLNNGQSPFYIYPAAGMHNVTLVVNNSFGCVDTVIKTAQVYYNPIASFTHNDVCFRDTIHFTSTSTVDFSTSITSHLWVFGDGGVTSNLINPVHYYSVPGTFNVTLVTTTANGCSAVANIPVKTFDPPVSGFTFNNTCLFDSVLLTNTSLNPAAGTIASWAWNFGDNSPINTNTWNPIHLYPNPGDYEITLITHSSNLGCADTLQDTITVFPMPVADFGSTNVCLNQVMYFNDSSTVASGSISAWEWNFGDSTPLANNQNPSNSFANATTYFVSLIATSIDGCKDTIAKNVVIHPLPTVQYSTANVCDGSVVSFTDLSTIPATDTILSYSWAFGDNSPVSTNKNTSHLYPSAGYYNVQLSVVSYFGCVDSTTKISIINPNPVVNFTVNDTAGCEPLCITFQDSSAISTGTNS